MSPLRRLLTVTSTALCLLGVSTSLVGCSDDDKKDDKSTTTEGTKDDDKAESGDGGTDSTDPTDSTEPTDTAEEPPVTVTDDGFTEALKPAVDALNAAKEPCDVVNAVSQLAAMPDPTGEEQNRQAVDFLVLIVQKAADTTTDTAEADSLRSSAQALSDYAESVNYSTEKLDIAGEGPDIPEWDALNESMTAYFDTHAQECAPTEATDPVGGTGETPDGTMAP
jgi:hypothetical protein